jgi:flavin reductase (DIM6/NTAB) family NADH-FMN oxidoreductase RutF
MPLMNLTESAPLAHTTVHGEIDPDAFRQALGRFASGVTVVTSVDPVDGRPQGMTANAFVSVSLEPPLALVSLARNARMLDVVTRAPRFAVSILHERQSELALHFAGRSDPDLTIEVTVRAGVPVLSESVAYLVMRRHELRAAGDHVLLLGLIEELGFDEARAPLAYYGGRFHRLAPSDHTLELWPEGPEPIWM